MISERTPISMGTKLIVLFSVLASLTAFMAAGWWWTAASMKASYDTAVEQTVGKITLADTISTAQSDMLGGQRGLILYTLVKDQARAAKAKDLFHVRAEVARQALTRLDSMVREGEVHDIAARMQSGLTEWQQGFSEMEGLCEQNRITEAIDVGTRKGLTVYAAVGKDTARLNEIQKQELATERESMASLNRTTRLSAIIMWIIAAVAGVFVLFATRRICTTVRQVAAEMDEGAQQVVSAATQVSQASQMLAKTASEQAAALEQTSASSEQINAMAARNAQDCRTAASLVGDTQKQFGVAETSLAQMVGSIHEISESSDKISNINKIIDGIAFQTNILALNAAVEAARAGEAGLGFAVVADEVRTLAQRCGEASRNTAQLIEESINRSHGGTAKVDAVGDVLKTLSGEATRIQSLVQEISEASVQQVNGTGEMNRAIGQMEKTTQQTAAYAEESASAAEELNSQAEILHNMVGKLTALVGTR